MNIKLLLSLLFSLSLFTLPFSSEANEPFGNESEIPFNIGTQIDQKSDTVDTVRSKVAIREVVMGGASGLNNIYNRYLIKEPNLQGKVKIKFVIVPSGEVAKATILETSMNRPQFEKEILQRVKSWNFGSVPKGVATVIYPFNFSSSDDESFCINKANNIVIPHKKIESVETVLSIDSLIKTSEEYDSNYNKDKVSIIINNWDVDSVEIEIDNKSIGYVITPYKIYNIEPGWHKIFVRNKWGYVDFKERQFDAGNIYTQYFKAEEPTGGIIIESQPAGAKVTVNGRLIGVTPLKIQNLKSDLYYYTLEHPWYQKYDNLVSVNINEYTKILIKLNDDISGPAEPVRNNFLNLGGLNNLSPLKVGVRNSSKSSKYDLYIDYFNANSAHYDGDEYDEYDFNDDDDSDSENYLNYKNDVREKHSRVSMPKTRSDGFLKELEADFKKSKTYQMILEREKVRVLSGCCLF